MRARLLWVWLGFVLFVPGLFAQAKNASPVLLVNERKMWFQMEPQFRLEVPVLSSAAQTLPAHVHLEFLEEDDKVVEVADIDTSILPGSHTLVLPLTFKSQPNSSADLYWWRLRYSISPRDSSVFPRSEAIVNLGRIIPSTLSVGVAAMRRPRRGAVFPVRVKVVNVASRKPLGGAVVQAFLEDANDDKLKPVSIHPATTDALGYALLSVKLPVDADEDGQVKITARRGPWIASQSVHFDLEDRVTLTMSTDKPIYQPGQTLHMRVLGLGEENHAIADESVTFSIWNEDDETQFKQVAVTSNFGIASADWEIPPKLRPGRYEVSVAMEKKGVRDRAEVRISRYELPEFTVTPEMDKPYYLPGQQARVEVSAGYLFGQPVKKGTVRIVRDNGANWNSEKKIYEPDEDEVEHGEFDSSGRFSSSLDLSDDFDRLQDSDYLRYRDIRFAAYVTDLSTNRTEEKHFTVRISKEAIHIYVVNPSDNSSEPMDWYITTAFPDGTPASADVTISAVKPSAHGDFPEKPGESSLLRLARVHTNRYGVGHFHANAWPKDFLAQSYNTRARLLLQATAEHGRHGTHSEDLWLYSQEYLRIMPARGMLAAGENVIADIESSAPDQLLFLDLLSPNAILSSTRVQLLHGRARVEFPYDPSFRGSLYIIAYNMKSKSEKEEEKNLAGGAEVIFPGLQSLDLGVHLERTTYKPGESASADFQVRDPEGHAAQTALGVMIYDKAVAERVRSDEEFGSYGFYFYPYDWTGYQAIAGVSYADLLNRKLTASANPDLELLAEAVLASRDSWDEAQMMLEFDDRFTRNPADIFRIPIDRSLARAEEILKTNYVVSGTYPATPGEFRSLLAGHGYNFDLALDPWGVPYRLRYSIVGSNALLEIRSNGPDKLPDTKDDITVREYQWPFFTSVGRVMDKAMLDDAQMAGKYIQDLSELRAQLAARRINLDDLRDPWGQPYSFSFEVHGPQYEINVLSHGPDGAAHEKGSSAKLVVWHSGAHYFLREAKEIQDALARDFVKTSHFPTNEDEFRAALQLSDLDPASFRDPWGNPYHFEFQKEVRYFNNVNISVYSNAESGKLIPVTQQLAWIYVVSYGPRHNQAEKFEVTAFSQLLTEQSSNDLAPRSVSQMPFQGSSGAIRGVITDASGAIIANAMVTATNDMTDVQATTKSDQSGVYLLPNLLAGNYRLRIEYPGFKASIVGSVPVMSSIITRVDVTMAVGAVSETVEVSSAAPAIQTTSVSASKTVNGDGSARIQPEQQVFTPRLRKYFPETLLWRPELITDSSGRAQLKFDMADNITTWKMSVIGSTVNGQMGLAEKELRTFQPFFIDHDPPKILTQGDQIELPVVLRNYLNKSQEVDVKLSPSDWFKALSAMQTRVSVPAGQDAVAKFLISADRSIRDGKEQVTAANHQTGDAVQHTLTVHPDGEDVTQTNVQVLSGERGSLELQIPQNAIPGSIDAQLKIYASLQAHVLDSLSGMIARPAGCGEQITSIAFGSVIVLQVLRKAGQDDPKLPGNPNTALAALARKYVNQAYQQLAALQNSNGGFPYWLNDEPDAALTAYISDFLVQASQFIDVDRERLAHARDFLVSLQEQDGAWSWITHDGKHSPDSNLTAEIARSLAQIRKMGLESAAADRAFGNAMDYLAPQISSLTSPYLLGQYVLAAVYSGRSEDVVRARKVLAGMVHEEGPGTYWNLEANSTPFYGWGLAGRLETTGIAVQALAQMAQTTPDPQDRQLINRGLIFLLRHKDRYGVWYSTHASVDALRAIVAAMPESKSSGHGGMAQILVNGKPAREVRLPAENEITGPVLTDISSLMVPGTNKIEIVRHDDGSPLQAQITATHYIPWADSHVPANFAFRPGESRALRLNVSFDHAQAEVGKIVRCNVEVERVGFQGYGMLLGEIGLPPGADVDRASLQAAQASGAISQYEVMPDRVVVYVWPRAGGSKFNFNFRPRFAMNAETASSILYDYYNPEAQATVAPTRFRVQ